MRLNIIIARIGFAVLAVVIGLHFMLTGSPIPIFKIDSLQNPVAVKGWTPDGLTLADGRVLPVPGIKALPGESPALSEITKRGVEIGADGKLYGLIQIHHWCGNDPVRKHLARVDIAAVLKYLRVGQSEKAATESVAMPFKPGGSFTKWGWNVSEYHQFQLFQTMADSRTQ